MTTYTEQALQVAKTNKDGTWKEGLYIMQAIDAGETTLREYAVRRDGHDGHEQAIGLWVGANRFRGMAKDDFEQEFEEIWKAGLTDITYYALANRYMNLGASAQEAVELLQDCITEQGQKGIRWMEDQIDISTGRTKTYIDNIRYMIPLIESRLITTSFLGVDEERATRAAEYLKNGVTEMKIIDILSRFRYYVENYKDTDKKPDQIINAALGTISKAAGGDANRKLVQKALCGKTSSKDMTDAEKFALVKFAAPAKIAGHWSSEHGMGLIDMCHLLLEDLARQPGQAEIFTEV